jgi:hypothetical protein
MKKQTLVGGLVLAMIMSIVPSLASAQVFPFQFPWNRNNGGGGSTTSISGTVTQFSGYNMTLNGGQSVSLHQGTVINPTGTTIQPGMNVVVSGYPNGGTFDANEVDVNGSGGGYYGNNGGNYNGRPYPNGYNNGGNYPNGSYNGGSYPNGYYNGDRRADRDRWERDRLARERAADHRFDRNRYDRANHDRDDHRDRDRDRDRDRH